ncbi:MAG: glycosyltransferase family 2 protein [Sphingomonadaceae bacterium]
MADPTFSIITVSYNEEATIASTLQSILGQRWEGKELIVVDGQSNDGTLAEVGRFLPFIHHFRSEPDRGLYDAMNKGLELASGDYVCFMNAGDRFHASDVLERIAGAAGDATVVLFGRARIRSERGEHLNPGPHERPGDWLGRGFPSHQATFYPRRFAEHARYDMALGTAADTDYSLRAIAACGWQFVDVVVCDFALGGISNRLANWREAVSTSRHRWQVWRRHVGQFQPGFVPKYLGGPIAGWMLKTVFGQNALTWMRHRLGSR